MKENIVPAFWLSLIFLMVFSGIYTLTIWTAALLAPHEGAGRLSAGKDQSYYTDIGQSFTDDRYFWSRPSAVAYNAAGSAGSNKGPTNPDYLQTVRDRIDTLLAHHPGVRREDIPSDLLTASGSGLDPHISPEAALIQVTRVAKTRGLPEERLRELVAEHTEKPWLGLFGPRRVHVLRLNLALDMPGTDAGPSTQNDQK